MYTNKRNREQKHLTLAGISLRKLYEGIKGERGGGAQSDPSPLLLTPMSFQLSETTWCLIGLYGNRSYTNGITNGRNLGFLNFQILLKFDFQTVRKQHLAIGIYKTVKIHGKVVSI